MIFFFLHIRRDNNPLHLTFLQRILKLDLVGCCILLPTVICLLLALQWGGTTYAWNSSHIIGLLVGSAILACSFVYSQIEQGDGGVMPPPLFRNRNVLCAILFGFFFGAGFFSLLFYIAIDFQAALGSSATKSGLQLLPLLVSTVISSIVTGGLISVIGVYKPFMMICIALFAVDAVLLTTYSLTTPFGQWFGYQVLAGSGIGVGFKGGILVIQTVLSLEDVPIGITCLSCFQSLGGSVFLSVAQTLFANGLVSGLEEHAPSVDSTLLLKGGATSIR